MATQTMPTPVQIIVRKPNLFRLHGSHHHIVYSTSGIDNQPQLQYHDALQTHNFSGSQIKTTATEIGTLVTVTTQLTVDSGSTTFSLLIPNINLGSANETTIHTIGVTTHHRFSIVPALNTGQLETYNEISLQGSAAFVVF